jgi:gamma-glutamylputrescine oxidase
MNLLYANDRAGQFPPSYYAATAIGAREFPALQGEVRADVCVIGAGYTGLSAALHLAQAGVSVVVLDAHRPGFGASGRNGGQVGSGQRQDQSWIETQYGRTTAHALWQMGQDAKALVKSLIAQHNIPSPFAHGVAHAARTPASFAAMRLEAEKLSRDYGYDQIEVLGKDDFCAIVPSPAYIGGVIDRGAGHIHPLNFCIGLGNAAADAGAQIFATSPVHHIVQGTAPIVHTAAGRVICETVILAGNGYGAGLTRPTAARVMPINNFIIATEALGAEGAKILTQNIAVADDRFVVNYWRMSEDGRLLFGGGESYGYRFGDIIPKVMKPLLQVYPHLRGVKVDYAWGGTLAITRTRMPYAARLGGGNVLTASGYSGHGVALATQAGKLLAQAAQGSSAEFDLLTSIAPPPFPGGGGLRWPLLVGAMSFYSLRDRLGL